MKQRGWSVWCQGEGIEKEEWSTKILLRQVTTEGRMEYKDFASSSDQNSDRIRTTSNNT